MSFFRSVFSLRRALALPGSRRPKSGAASRPRLEQLEDRLTPSTTVSFVDDNWADLTRSSGAPQIGDIVQNLNDTINTGGVTAVYGITGFGTVVTDASGTAPGAATINDAIANTNSGGTVDVLEGTYNEEVVISKALTLEGAQAGTDPGASVPATQSIIMGTGGNGPIEIAPGVNNVTIDGLTIQSPAAGSGALSAGVWTDGSTGIAIEDNVIQNNTAGVAIGDSAVTVQHNLIQNNNAAGSGSGTGVEFFTATSQTSTVSSNHFTGNANGDVLIAGGGTVSNVTISDNVLTNSGGIELFQASGVMVTGNTAGNMTGPAIYIGGGDSNITVSGNSVTGVGKGLAALDIENLFAVGANSTLTVTNNTFNVNGQGGAAIEVNDNGTPGSAYTGTLTLSGDQITTSGADLSILNQSSTPIDATGETFNGVAASTATTAQLFAVEDTIVDAIDVSGFGLVRLKAGDVYVTPTSFFAPTTTAPSIQRGVDAASAGDTVNVEAGTYTNTTGGGDSVVNIDKPLTVQGTDGAAGTIIDGASATYNYYVVKITASNVTLSGFTITNPLYSGTADASGVLVESLTNNAPLTGVNVTGNIIHDIGLLNRASALATLGVNVEGVNSGSGVIDSSIQGNTIYNIGNADPSSFAVGVLTAGDVGQEVNNDTISGNTIYNVSNPSLAAGVDVGYGSENIAVNGNTIGLNGGSAGPVGVGIRTGSGVFGPVTITNNMVENATVAGDQLDSPFSQTVTGDNLQHDAVGVDVENGTASLQNLTLSNDGTGFTASNVVAVNLSDLTLTNNATAGGTISNVTSVNDTPSSGDTGVTTTITGGSFQSGANQAVSYTNVKELNVTGSSGADTFNVTPSAATTITIHGELPTPPASPGDTLAMNLTGAASPKLMDAFNASTGYSGAWTFGNKMAVIFDGIETLTPSGPSVAVLKTSGELDLLAPTGALKEISPAGTIQAVSATFDASFNNDVFAIVQTPGYAGTLWEYSDAFGWKEISSGSFQQISATTNAAGQAVVFGVLTDGSLWEQNPAGAGLNVDWQNLSPAGTIQSVSAVTDAAGNDVVFAVVQTPGYVGTLWEHSPALSGNGWAELSSGTFTQVSGGRNAAGQAIVFGVLTDGSLWEQNPAGAGLNVDWTQRSGPGTVLSVTAGGSADEAFVIETDHHLYQLTPSALTLLSSQSFSSVSATETTTGQDEVFATLLDSSFYEYSPTLPGDHFQQILANGVASSSVAPHVA